MQSFPPQDKRDIQLFLTGNSEAYHHIVERHYRFIFQTIQSVLYKNMRRSGIQEDIHALSKDVTHDFLCEHLPQVLSKYDSTYPFRSWLARVASNYTIDKLRRRPKGQVYLTEITDDEGSPLERQIADNLEPPDQIRHKRQLSHSLEYYIEQLGSPYNYMIRARFYEDMSYEEIAKNLKMPIGTVKAQISRAVSYLRKRMEKNSWNKEDYL
ncbi:MAG: RNA polymerase sigma factor [Bacteroidia bacterium]